VLWLFTDAARLPDPSRAVAGLPRGLCGVVFRHDGVPGRAALARRISRICHERRLALVIAGDDRLSGVAAGTHARGGRRPARISGHARRGRWVTSSAHSVPDLVRARAAGVALVFISPVFPTESHPEARSLGLVRFEAFGRRARRLGLFVAALGGLDGERVRALSPVVTAVGAIGALV
jgi:thiamine-phosphate pyrophosphorylase